MSKADQSEGSPNNPDLGRLEHVNVRTVWPSESANFTPWLSQPENLALLGRTLNLDLVTEAVEKSVGTFSADLVCRNLEDNSRVLIENQFSYTDHDHLGKLLTYAGGLQAQTVIWLSELIRPEHRAALDWLNEISLEDVQFFGLEIELWKIRDSIPAVKFNIVSKPNDWSRSVALRGRGEPTELQELQAEYWKQFLEYLGAHHEQWNSNRKPRAQHWMSWSSGNADFLYRTIVSSKQWIRVELYIESEYAKYQHDLLEEDKDEIESTFVNELVWNDQTDRAKGRRISCYLRDVDVNDRADWKRQHEFLADNLQRFSEVFPARFDKFDETDYPIGAKVTDALSDLLGVNREIQRSND